MCAGGWLHTGDQGMLDTEGYLTLTGRIKELINRGGEKISPIEACLHMQRACMQLCRLVTAAPLTLAAATQLCLAWLRTASCTNCTVSPVHAAPRLQHGQERQWSQCTRRLFVVSGTAASQDLQDLTYAAVEDRLSRKCLRPGDAREQWEQHVHACRWMGRC